VTVEYRSPNVSALAAIGGVSELRDERSWLGGTILAAVEAGRQLHSTCGRAPLRGRPK